MATVFFSNELQVFTGEENAEVSAENYRELLAELTIKYPDLKKSEIVETAITINGEIVHDPLLESIPPSAGLHVMQMIAGG